MYSVAKQQMAAASREMLSPMRRPVQLNAQVGTRRLLLEGATDSSACAGFSHRAT